MINAPKAVTDFPNSHFDATLPNQILKKILKNFTPYHPKLQAPGFRIAEAFFIHLQRPVNFCQHFFLISGQFSA